MASSERITWASNADNQGRVRFFLIKAGIAVMNEDAGTPNHVNRKLYAARVLAGSADIFQAAVGVTTDATVGSAIDSSSSVTDTDMENAISSQLNAYAGT